MMSAALWSSAEEPNAEGWISLFDGKSLNGWKINENPESWKVVDGLIVCNGQRSHLFSEKEYADFAFKADVKASKNSNSGMYFRTKFELAWPTGYEAQVNNTYVKDPRKTGSLYRFSDIKEQLVEDDTWWTQEIIAQGNHIIIKVNGKVVTDYVDTANTFQRGHLALQAHDPGSTVYYRNLFVKPLPSEDKK